MDFARVTLLANPELIDTETAKDIGRALEEGGFDGRIDYERGLLHVHGIINADGRTAANLADHLAGAGVVLEWCPDYDQEEWRLFVGGRVQKTEPADLLITWGGATIWDRARELLKRWELPDADAATERRAAFDRVAEAVRDGIEDAEVW